MPFSADEQNCSINVDSPGFIILTPQHLRNKQTKGDTRLLVASDNLLHYVTRNSATSLFINGM